MVRRGVCCASCAPCIECRQEGQDAPNQCMHQHPPTHDSCPPTHLQSQDECTVVAQGLEHSHDVVTGRHTQRGVAGGGNVDLDGLGYRCRTSGQSGTEQDSRTAGQSRTAGVRIEHDAGLFVRLCSQGLAMHTAARRGCDTVGQLVRRVVRWVMSNNPLSPPACSTHSTHLCALSDAVPRHDGLGGVVVVRQGHSAAAGRRADAAARHTAAPQTGLSDQAATGSTERSCSARWTESCTMLLAAAAAARGPPQGGSTALTLR